MKCSFCGDELTPGTGKLYIKKDGKVLTSCSNKCQKHMLKLRHKPRDFKWTEEGAQ